MLGRPSVAKRAGNAVQRFSSTQLVHKDKSENKVSRSKLKNGLNVVTAETESLCSNLTLLINAGSRYENPSTNLGVSHCLRAAACLSSDKSTAFNSIQLLGSLGGTVDVSGTRDHIAYSLKCGRRVWRDLVTEALVPNILGGHYFWWELQDVSKAMKHQLAQAECDPAFRLMEAVHCASFRGGLSNSVMSPSYMIGSHSSDMVKEFFNNKYTLNNMVLAGTGINHNELCDVGDVLFNEVPAGQVQPPNASEFVQSEVRDHESGPMTYAALSFAGAALNDQDAIAIAVLQNVLGGSPRVKRQSGHASRLGGAVGKNVKEPFTVSSFNINYTDAGLLGVYIKCDPESIEKALKAISEETAAIGSGKISDAEVNASKESLKSDILMQCENSAEYLGDLVVQISTLDGYISPEDIASKIDAVTTSQVSRVAKKVLGGKKSLAAIGNIAHCPYLSDL